MRKIIIFLLLLATQNLFGDNLLKTYEKFVVGEFTLTSEKDRHYIFLDDHTFVIIDRAKRKEIGRGEWRIENGKDPETSWDGYSLVLRQNGKDWELFILEDSPFYLRVVRTDFDEYLLKRY